MPERIGAAFELGEEAGLPNSRLSHDLEQCGPAVLKLRERSIHCVELRGTADDRASDHGHLRPFLSVF